jgi:hypothetical protein
MKFIYILLIAIASNAAAQSPLVLMKDGSLAAPAADAPLSKEQKAKAVGNAALIRTPKGEVFLVTAAHVADIHKIPYQLEGDDIAVLKKWPAGAFPGADKLPELVPYREHVPVTVRAWSFTRAAPVDKKFDAIPLTHIARESVKRTVLPNGTEFRFANGQVLGLDYWRTRMIEYREPDVARVDETLLSTRTAGALVLQDGNAVGVICGHEFFNLEDHVYFQTLLAGKQPRGLPAWTQ